jgi:hypothetical protein
MVAALVGLDPGCVFGDQFCLAGLAVMKENHVIGAGEGGAGQVFLRWIGRR